MREGRRKRLGLATGTTSTVGDTYLDRILTDEEAANTRNVVKADQNVNFDAGNYNYVTDLYDYFSSGGAEEDTTPVVTPPNGGGGGGGDGGGGTSVGSPPNDGGDGTFIGGGATLEDAGGTAPGGGYTTDYYGDVTGTPDLDLENQYEDDDRFTVGSGKPPDLDLENQYEDEDRFTEDRPTYADTLDPNLLDEAGGEMGGADGYGIINDSPDLELENQYEDEDRFTEETPIDYSEFDDLEADAGSVVTTEDVQDEKTFMDKFKDLLPEDFDFKKAVISGLINAVAGKPITVALNILKGALSETSSQTEYDSYSPEQKAAIDAAYGSGGVMQGYNAVSAYGEGVEATVDKRVNDYEKNYTSTEIEGFLTNPNHTYSKLKDLQNKAGLKTTKDTETDDDSESDMLETLDLDLENQYEDDDRFTDTPKPYKDPIMDMVDTEADRAKAAKDKAAAEAAELDRQKRNAAAEKAAADRAKAAKDKAAAEAAELDRQKRNAAAEKAAADRAKAAKDKKDMQQRIRDYEKQKAAEKVEKDRQQRERDAADAARERAADRQRAAEKAENDRQKRERDAAEAAKEKADRDREDRDRQNEQDAKDNQSGYGGSCFIAGTKVTMSDGTLKNIEDVKVGDKVKGHKEDNTVIKLDPTLLATRKLYSFNNNDHYFFTSEHPFMTEKGWKSIKPEKTKERDGVELYKQLKGELKVGDKLVTDNGPIEITDIKSKEMNNPKMPLYNFNVSNDSSYIADDYVVHNKGCFIKGTLITMADGTTKPVEQVDLGEEVAEGGKVFATGKFLVENLHDYKGIKVSGSHMVNEDGNWVRVEDSKHGKPLGDDEHTVYVFGSENRRILINGILFTDYFETTEQEKLINDEKDFFNNWKTYENKTDQDNINILNAS